VLGTIAMESVGPIMVASVVANIAMRSFPGYRPTYQMPAFADISGIEVLLFALMGVLVGGAAALFLRGQAGGRRQFARLPRALPLRLALGGLIVGLISVAVPQVWGNGYSVVNGVLHDPGPWWLLLALLVAKVLATLATAGSGAVGGVFTPALFVGCLVGSLFGHGVHALWPAATSASSVYAIVGMGAFLAAATQAPLMAVGYAIVPRVVEGRLSEAFSWLTSAVVGGIAIGTTLAGSASDAFGAGAGFLIGALAPAAALVLALAFLRAAR